MNTKKVILTIITVFLFFVCLFLSYLLFNRFFLKRNFEDTYLSFANKNQNTVFKIEDIVLFSSCDAKNKTSSASNFTIENLYQYTDIAVFLKSTSDKADLSNTLKKVIINNIKFNTKPNLGEPSLYFKSINNFAKSDIVDENLISDNLEFSVTSDDEANLDLPTLYNNLANPITLSYINTNIKSDYTLTDTSSPISYDGSLLSKCNISLDDLYCNLSFDIYITNNLDQEFKSSIFIDIPLQNEEETIYNGSIINKEKTNYLFYRYN